MPPHAQRIAVLLAAAGLTALAGCTTYYGAAQREAAQEREDVLLLREDLRRVAGRVEALEMQNDQLQADLEAVRRKQEAWAAAERETTQARFTDLERRIGAVDAARVKDRKDVVDSLSAKVSELIRKLAPDRGGGGGGARRGPAGSDYGYEHVVKGGETVSTIAAAYGVQPSAIVEANHLRDPDVVRVGQVLFIPER